MLNIKKHPTHPDEWTFLYLCAQPTINQPQLEILNELLNKVNWEILFDLANNHCVNQILYRNLVTYFNSQTPAEVASNLRKWTHQYAIKSKYDSLVVTKLLKAFSAEGVDAIPLKGPALAFQLYGNTIYRDSVDIDIAVKPTQVEQAQNVMNRLGFRLESALPNIPLKHILKMSNAVVYSSPKGSSNVDLHWQFTKEMEGFAIDGWNFWDRLETSSFEGLNIQVLSNLDTFILLILHASKDHFDRLKHLTDFWAFVERFPSFDWDAASAMVRGLSLEPQMFLLMSLCAELYGAHFDLLEKSDPKAKQILGGLKSCALQSLFYYHQSFRQSLNRIWFVLNTIEQPKKKLAYLLQHFFKPNPFDWAWCKLPEWAFFLYPFVHLLRIAVSFVRKSVN